MTSTALRTSTMTVINDLGDTTVVIARSVGRAILIALGVLAGALALWFAANAMSTAPASAATKESHTTNKGPSHRTQTHPTPPPPGGHTPQSSRDPHGDRGRQANKGPATNKAPAPKKSGADTGSKGKSSNSAGTNRDRGIHPSGRGPAPTSSGGSKTPTKGAH